MKKILFLLATLFCLNSIAQTYPYVIPNKDYAVNVLTNSGLDATGVASAVDYLSGAVYTCGYINTASSGKDFVLVKFDSTGTQQWIATYDFMSLNDKANALVIDGSGNIYVTGYSEAATGNADIITIKYSSSGSQQWVYRYNGTNSTNDEGKDIAIDGSGNIWVCGYATTTSKGKDFQLLRFNSSGTLLSAPKRNGTANGDDIAEKMAISGSNLFATGTIKNTTTNGDIVTYCVNTTSVNVTWSVTANGTANSDDTGLDLKLDNGEVFICGQINNTTTGNDYYFARLNQSTGAVKYSNSYDGGYNGSDIASSLVPDALGNYAVTGLVTNGSNNEYHTRLYDTSTVKWTHVQPINGTYTLTTPRIATDTIAQHFYVCGTYSNTTLDGMVYQLTPSGNRSWVQYHDGSAGARDAHVALVLDGIGRIYLASANETSTTSVYLYMLIRYSQTPVYMPVNYNMASDTFSFAHLFYPNSGEVVDSSRNAVPEILYYTKFTSPVEFIQKNRISFCHYKNDTDKVSPTDTISRIDMWFNGANEFSEIFAVDFQNTAKLNYFLEYTGSNGLTNVKGASHLICPNIYPMVDLHYSSNTNGAKYYFVVKPTGDPVSIQLHFDGAVSTSTVGGNLRVVSFLDSFEFKKPNIYNVSVPSFTNLSITTTSVTGTSGWVDMGSDTYSINPGTYNTACPLVIEFDRGRITSPTDIQNIKWSTYLGSGGNDWVFELKSDANDNLYAVGETFATLFPKSTGYQNYFGGNSDGFVAKFDSTGFLRWSSYIGGTRTDYIKDLDFNSDLEVYCVGTTNSASIPLHTPSGAFSQNFVGPYQSGFGYHNDGFIFQLDTTGSTCKWFTYYVGNQDDYFYGCKMDVNNNFFIVGGSMSTNLPTSGPSGSYISNYNRSNSGYICDSCHYDGYIVKFDASYSRSWSTYIGSDTITNSSYQNANDFLYDVCLEDPSDNPPQDVYVTGYSGSFNYPTLVNGGSTNYNYNNRSDAIVTHFSNSGTIIYSSYFGSGYFDYGLSLVYKAGKLYVTGFAGDNDFQTDSSGMYYFQRHKGLNDAFYIIMNGNTDVVLHASYIGDTGNDEASDIVVDNNNIVYIAGRTTSSNFPVPPSQPANTYNHSYRGNTDDFLCALEYSNQNLDWSTCIGGTDPETAIFDSRFTTICFNSKNKLYLGGSSRSDSAMKFPLDDGGGIPFFNPLKKGFWDGTITKFDLIPLITIGIKENILSMEGVSVYPNPTTNHLFVKLKDGMENVNYRVFDVTGKQVGFGKLFTTFNTIPVNNLREGMYFLEIYDNKNRASTKFIKYD